MASKTSFEFRRAVGGDAAQVSKLIGSTWAKFFAYSVTEADLETYLTTTVSEAQIRREITSDRTDLFLLAYATPTNAENKAAAETDTIIGVAQLKLDTVDFNLTTEYPVELHRLYIDSNHQGSGLAGGLLRYTEDTCREIGKRGLWLGVWEDNARGIRFYEKMGFERRGEHSFWVGESQRRDWIMEKAL